MLRRARSPARQAFPKLARELGTALNNEPELRPTICAALGRLIKSSCAFSTAAGAADGAAAGQRIAANRAAVGAFAKNFLPILFNLYTTTPPDVRNYLLDAVRSWVAVADKPLLNNLFATVVRKLLDVPDAAAAPAAGQLAPQAVRHAMLDLALALAPALDGASAGLLYRTVTPFLVVRPGHVRRAKQRRARSPQAWRLV